MTLKESMQFLFQHEYVTANKSGKLSFSKKFYDEWSQPGSNLPTVLENKTDRYIRFIQEAEVPQRCEDTRGNPYSTNKYSKEAEVEFNKMLDLQGIDYDLLVNTVKLYYKNGVRLKKAIGNYITTGAWRTDYEALKAVAGTGEVELHEHIKNELKDGSYSPYTF